MRDSINYNLNYFIMRKSGTKPMKNTMRKQSPIKFFQPVTTATNAVNTAISAAKKSMLAAKKAKSKGTTKGATTSGTYTKPTTETSVKTGTIKSNPAGKPTSNTETSVKAAPTQRKSVMKKKC